MTRLRALLLGSVAIGLIGNAHASPVVLFDNIPPLSTESGGGAAVASFSQSLGDGPLGASFVTGGTAALVTGVSLDLFGESANLLGSIQVTIDSNSVSGTPVFGTPVATLGTIFDTQMLAGSSNTIISLATSVALAPDTTYWVVLTDNSGVGNSTSINWSISGDLAGVGATGGSYYVDGAAYANADGGAPFGGAAFQMSVDAIPEPASITIVGAGVLGLGALRRRCRR